LLTSFSRDWSSDVCSSDLRPPHDRLILQSARCPSHNQGRARDTVLTNPPVSTVSLARPWLCRGPLDGLRDGEFGVAGDGSGTVHTGRWRGAGDPRPKEEGGAHDALRADRFSVTGRPVARDSAHHALHRFEVSSVRSLAAPSVPSTGSVAIPLLANRITASRGRFACFTWSASSAGVMSYGEKPPCARTGRTPAIRIPAAFQNRSASSVSHGWNGETMCTSSTPRCSIASITATVAVANGTPNRSLIRSHSSRSSSGSSR